MDLVAKGAAHGDPAAVQALLQMIVPVVVRYCRARMGGRNQSFISAEDVAQETCLAVLKALPSYTDRGGHFLHLVYAITANKVADAFRAASRDRSEPVPELPELAGDNEPETLALHQSLSDRLNHLLQTLPPHQRELIVLRLVVGLSVEETAEALGVTPGHVRTTQHRTLHKLRKSNLAAWR